jgi:hypothetical protein
MLNPAPTFITAQQNPVSSQMERSTRIAPGKRHAGLHAGYEFKILNHRDHREHRENHKQSLAFSVFSVSSVVQELDVPPTAKNSKTTAPARLFSHFRPKRRASNWVWYPARLTGR